MPRVQEKARPEARRRVDDAIVQKLRKTEETGKSVPIPLNGQPLINVSSRYRQHMLLKYRKRIGTKRDGDTVLAWIEKD